jgi:hypothetical protein
MQTKKLTEISHDCFPPHHSIFNYQSINVALGLSDRRRQVRNKQNKKKKKKEREENN